VKGIAYKGPKQPTGRPRAVPYHPNLAAKAKADYEAADKVVKQYEDLRQDAFIRMLKSGMTTYQIAEFTGLKDGSIRYWADATGTKRRRLHPTRVATVIEQHAAKAKGGSPLFG
jgi:hypothetical protein